MSKHDIPLKYTRPWKVLICGQELTLVYQLTLFTFRLGSLSHVKEDQGLQKRDEGGGGDKEKELTGGMYINTDLGGGRIKIAYYIYMSYTIQNQQ